MKKTFQLHQAKKRNRKVMITEIAIEKVPYIRYEGLSQEQNEIMQGLAKLVLRLAKDKNNSNEVAVTSDLACEHPLSNCGMAFGDEVSVDICADTLSFHLLMSGKETIIVMLHNHPSTRTFSLKDIEFMILYERLRIFVVVTNQGTIHYMKKNENFDVKEAIIMYNNIIRKYLEKNMSYNMYQAALEFLNDCDSVGLYYE